MDHEKPVHDVPADWPKRAWVDDAKYREMYARSVKDPNGFWGEQAKRIDRMKPFNTEGSPLAFSRALLLGVSSVHPRILDALFGNRTTAEKFDVGRYAGSAENKQPKSFTFMLG